MGIEARLIVFSDLDGTLIDHETYRWDDAKPALRALERVRAGVVLASSKTSAEMSLLRASLGLEDWPAIVENGAGVLSANVSEIRSGSRYRELRSVLATLPKDLRSLFRGFGDATTEQVAEMTGLSLAAAALAKQRQFSEPGKWRGTQVQRAEFLNALDGLGVKAQIGGRFLTLSFGGNKVEQMRAIIETYAPAHTIALGDAPNDVQMLEYADIGVVVQNPHHSPLPLLKGEDEGRILRSKSAGPLGWNEAILALLERLNLN